MAWGCVSVKRSSNGHSRIETPQGKSGHHWGPPGREGTCSCSGSGYRQLSHVLKRGGLGSMFLSCHLGLDASLKERGIYTEILYAVHLYEKEENCPSFLLKQPKKRTNAAPGTGMGLKRGQ